jgi:hypothetical protein
MKHWWGAPLVVLTLIALAASEASGQSTTQEPPQNQRIAGTLGANYPNPFNPETTIPFTLGMDGNPPVCTDPSKRHTVSLKIYNLLTQPIAVPILQGGGMRAGEPVEKLTLECGSYTAFWDGTRMGTDQKVPSGLYIFILEVDGRGTSRKMFVAK